MPGVIISWDIFDLSFGVTFNTVRRASGVFSRILMGVILLVKPTSFESSTVVFKLVN